MQLVTCVKHVKIEQQKYYDDDDDDDEDHGTTQK